MCAVKKHTPLGVVSITQKITAIQPHQKDNSLLQIYLDEKPIVVVQPILVKNFGLRIGLEIEAEVIEKLIAAEEMMRAKNYALDLLREEIYSKSQMEQHLEKEGFSDDTINSIVTELIQTRHIRDRKFAEKWIQRRQRSNPRGRILLKQELIHKGVDRETAEQVVNNISSMNEERLAFQIAQKQARKYKSLPLQVAQRRLHGFLSRRGYDSELIIHIIRQVL